MKTVKLDLANCYGIKKLQATFDFTKARTCAVYAPNGSMKSSLAQTFKDIADGAVSKDRIFPDRASQRVIKDETGADMPKESVLVVRPYDEVLGHSTKTSTLLVNPKLRQEHETLHAGIDAAKETLLKALKEQSGSKKDLEKELSSTFTARDDQFYVALNRIKDGVPEVDLYVSGYGFPGTRLLLTPHGECGIDGTAPAYKFELHFPSCE
ncbi:MAG: hypothetical protein Q8K31_07105 [Burkholderiaceae bacterium]|nr:hypothetical protein [Burkholderiaceae bacterium]